MRIKEGGGILRVLAYYVYLLVVWGLFRLLVRMPDVIR